MIDVRILILGAVLVLAATAAPAQEPAPPAAQRAESEQQTPSAQPQRETPRPEDLEPGVDTSATAPSQSTPAEVPASPSSATANPQTQSAPAAASRPAGGRAMDRLELETTEITGNRELPKVLYIVPWKRSDLGDLIGKPVNSLLDEVLEPVDRDVFRRENRYYRALQAETAEAAAPAPPK